MSLKVRGIMMDTLFRFDWYRMGSFLRSFLVGVDVDVVVAVMMALDGVDISNKAIMEVVKAVQRMIFCRLSGASCKSELSVF